LKSLSFSIRNFPNLSYLAMVPLNHGSSDEVSESEHLDFGLVVRLFRVL